MRRTNTTKALHKLVHRGVILTRWAKLAVASDAPGLIHRERLCRAGAAHITQVVTVARMAAHKTPPSFAYIIRPDGYHSVG